MDEFLQFMKDFYAMTGIDLQAYKRPQMERRLTSLRTKHGHTTFRGFLDAMRTNPELLHEMLDKMTINVSEFLRNPERWETLVPYLKQGDPNVPFKAWSAACSTGEEPYTLALLMEEHTHRKYSILATDIDKNVLEQAQRGTYREHQVKSLPQQYVDEYFVVSQGLWQVKPMLQQHVSFKSHDLLSDPYPTSFDLIVCRNVLIYFTDDTKQKIIARFSSSLKPGGLLFVGSTEQFLHTDQQGLVSVAPFVYQKQRG